MLFWLSAGVSGDEGESDIGDGDVGDGDGEEEDREWYRLEVGTDMDPGQLLTLVPSFRLS